MVFSACVTYFINSCSEELKPNPLTVVKYKCYITIMVKLLDGVLSVW